MFTCRHGIPQSKGRTQMPYFDLFLRTAEKETIEINTKEHYAI